jgi:hypothetical protein
MRARAISPGEEAGGEGGWLGSSRGTAREEFLAKIEKSLVQRGWFKPIEGAPSHEYEVDACREGDLMGAESFAKSPFRPGSGDGVAHGGA